MRQSLDVVNRNADRLLNLTGQFLGLRRLEEGRLEINRSLLDFQTVLRDCIDEARPLADNKGQQLYLDSPDLPLFIMGDPVQLSQVVMNFFSNAIKYAPRGGQVKVTAAVQCDMVRVRVADIGIGIRAEDLSRIFEPFTRVADMSTGGAGLGLSITKGLIEAHNGKVWAESPGMGKNATFVFTLPKQERETR